MLKNANLTLNIELLKLKPFALKMLKKIRGFKFWIKIMNFNLIVKKECFLNLKLKYIGSTKKLQCVLRNMAFE